ncbi:aryl-phospho-beta-D-glucosidase BglA [Clostridium puniceum]|uniref:Aryl-phospho-beta-D-glucosidase BglA n=1 Tax=Clostridium puniceum TaxID=29367 RepID=A0A1S8TB33_9CLOT|nr:glycoside hydrolase family 1 protein [Clostridium puniceum]OOM74882.1 aryl-phospho-beta-D-glucosidase BglA [Clostridium puniceum]
MEKDFLWGNSVSSMQTEGAWNEGGKGLSVYDVIEETTTTSDWKQGIDSYHRYKEDFDLMAEQGMNCYRFQISWSRVNPLGDGDFNEEGIKFYHEFIDELLKRDIKPMICLYHFDMPLNLSKKYNGFLSKEVVKAFYNFSKRMIDEYADNVNLWITFNEQNFSFMDDEHSFGMAGCLDKNYDINKIYQIGHNMIIAHALVANYIHENTKCKIGGMIAYQKVYPATSHPKDILLAEQIDNFYNQNIVNLLVNGKYLPIVKQYMKNLKVNIDDFDEEQKIISKVKSDFIAFSYYQSMTVSHEKITKNMWINDYLKYAHVKNPYLKSTEWEWEIDSLAFRGVITELYNRYRIPIFPIENGIGVREDISDDNEFIEDDYRIEYHKDHIKALKDAIEIDGSDVLGYLGWGLIDIPSSSGDVEKRYGTVFVNRSNHDLKDLRRIPKKSFYWLKDVIKSNGENI